MSGQRRNARHADKEKFWRAAFVRFGAADVSVKEFCKRERLNPNTYQYWRAELRKRDEKEANAKPVGKKVLVPVRVVPVEEKLEAAAPGEFIEIITADGLQIRVPLTCSSSVISDLVAGLRSKKC